MSKLPFELLEMIFRCLCGKETLAVRLVCTEWEQTSRPFFAERYLVRSLFWLTRTDLRRLQSLARRFGPYTRKVYITTDRFTLSGLGAVWREYKRQRDYLRNLTETVARNRPDALLQRWTSTAQGREIEIEIDLVGSIVQPLSDNQTYGGRYFRHAYQQHQPLSPWKTLRLWQFSRQFLCNVLGQTWMRICGSDRRILMRIAKMMPRGELRAVDVSYESEQLNWTQQTFGRPSPAFAFELALLCADEGALRCEEYGEHVKRVVDEAMERKAMLSSSSR